MLMKVTLSHRMPKMCAIPQLVWSLQALARVREGGAGESFSTPPPPPPPPPGLRKLAPMFFKLFKNEQPNWNGSFPGGGTP